MRGAASAMCEMSLSAEKKKLLALLLEEDGVAAGSGEDRIKREPRSEPPPLSFAQERLWFLDQLEPGNPVYNFPVALRLRGSLDVATLGRSLNEVVRRHESLRTTFLAVGGQPVQVISASVDLPLPVVDLRKCAASEREQATRRRIDEEARWFFDLTRGPLLRTTLLRLGDEDHVLLLTMHHIVYDGWSMGVLARELAAFYEAFSLGRPSEFPELPVQYADFAIWQRKRLRGAFLDKHLAYWRERLDGAPPSLTLPIDHRRPVAQTYRGAIQSLVLSLRLSKLLKELSWREGATLFMVLLAAFKTLLHRQVGQDDIVIGAPIAGRNSVEIERLIGFFLNTLVLRTDLSGNPTFRELVGRVREVTLGAYAHQDLPFEKLLEELQPERDLSRTPLFQVFFNHLNPSDYRIELPGVEVEPIRPHELSAKFDLTLYVHDRTEEHIETSKRRNVEHAGIRFVLIYNADLFEQRRMAEMLEQYHHLLSQIISNPDGKIDDYSLVTPSARAVLPNPAEPLSDEWHGAIHERFATQAQRVPERVAVTDPHEVWRYKDLNDRSNQLAHNLLAGGIRRRDVVAIYGHRSASLVWAVLGILKAGAAFVILDPDYPATRLIEILRLAKPRGWLEIESAGRPPDALREFLATSCHHQLVLPSRSVAEQRGPLIEYPTVDPQVSVGPDDLACLVFTSGSTGRPKGILGRHGPLSHFLPWQEQAYGLCECDRFSMFSSLSHDPLQRDMFTPLQLGASIHIPDPEALEVPGRLAEWMRREEISIIHLAPALGRLLAETGPETADRAAASDHQLTHLRYAFFVGDVLTRQDVAAIRRLTPEVTCVNFYGSTETQRAVGHFVVPGRGERLHEEGRTEDRLAEAVPAGRGIRDVQMLVLNDAGMPAGIGEVGEIHVRSPHLAEGYLDDDALTRARFIVNPFANTPGDRIYKTGDRGRYLPDGNVEYLGRRDRQVKIRGFRIELAEVEAALAQHDAVREVAVVAQRDARDQRRLVAYVVETQSTSTLALRRFLRQKLPAHMIPAQFVQLQVLPRTQRGKVDRAALPRADGARQPSDTAPVAPRTPTERIIAEVWQAELGVDQVSVHDNFFDLGGHSLQSIVVIDRLQKRLSVQIRPRDLFLQTLGQLAAALDVQLQGNAGQGHV